MEDAEAEAVLLALGPTLEWHDETRVPTPGTNVVLADVSKECVDDTYSYQVFGSGSVWRASHYGEVYWAYHATGKWE